MLGSRFVDDVGKSYMYYLQMSKFYQASKIALFTWYIVSLAL